MNKKEFFKECKDLVSCEVYCPVTRLMDFIRDQEGFWDGNQNLPVNIFDLKCKDWEDEDGNRKSDLWAADIEMKPEWMEVYAVSEMLAKNLYEEGEIVAEFAVCPSYWFRVHNIGQSIAMDGCIQNIMRKLLVFRGVCTEEEAENLSV